MQLYYFDGEFISDDLFPLLDELSFKAREEITIYFSSNGGDPSLSYVFADSLWKLTKNSVRIKIVFYNYVHSATLYFLHYMARIKEDKVKTGLREAGTEITWSFLETTWGACHSITHTLDKEEDKVNYEVETQITNRLNTFFLTYYAKKLTKPEKEAFKKGKEVIFDAIKLQKLFGGDIIKVN